MVNISHKDVAMEIGIVKCAVLTMRQTKRVVSTGIELLIGETIAGPEETGSRGSGVGR